MEKVNFHGVVLCCLPMCFPIPSYFSFCYLVILSSFFKPWTGVDSGKVKKHHNLSSLKLCINPWEPIIWFTSKGKSAECHRGNKFTVKGRTELSSDMWVHGV